MDPVPQKPVPLHFQPATCKGCPLPWLQLPDVLKNTASRDSTGSQQQNLGLSLGIQAGAYPGIGKNGLDFRGKQQRSSLNPVKKGLHPHPVPGQKQTLLPLLPDRKGKNAVEPGKAFRSPPDIGVKDHLRIRGSQKPMPQVFQLPADFRRIVQLPVIDNGVTLPFPIQGHGLTAPGRIDHRQTGMQQPTGWGTVHAAAVGAPPGHGGEHLPQGRLTGFQPNHPGNGTHEHHTPLFTV